MADQNIRFKDKAGNNLYPQTKIGNILLTDGTVLDLSKYATITQLNEALTNLPHIKKEIVEELPLLADADENTLYLVPADTTEENNILLEYLLINGAWEMVGTTKTDLTGLVTEEALNNALTGKADASTTYTKTEVDSALGNKANASTTYTKTEVDSALGNKADASTTYTKTEVDTALGNKANASTTYTKTEVDTLISELSGEMGDIQYDVLD